MFSLFLQGFVSLKERQLPIGLTVLFSQSEVILFLSASKLNLGLYHSQEHSLSVLQDFVNLNVTQLLIG